MIVKGLGQVGSSSGSQRSPEVLRTRLKSVLDKIGVDEEFSVLNVILYPASSPVYDVELDSVVAVEALVRNFFKFTRRKDPVSRPPELDKVSVYHSVTTGTRIRLALLRVNNFYFVISDYKYFFDLFTTANVLIPYPSLFD